MRLLTGSVALALLFSVTLNSGAGANIDFWTAHSLVKVRPHDQSPKAPSRKVDISAARNEFESFQIVLHTRASRVAGVNVSASDLRSADGGTIPQRAIAVYRQSYIELRKASSVEGAVGEWPDALIPQVDRYWNERRKAFPLVLQRGRNQPVWIEIYVPLKTRPGSYRGDVTISGDGLKPLSVPVNLEVWDFALPSTSSLRTAFGLSAGSALKKHRGRYTSEQDLYWINALYTKSALMHRLSIYGGTMIPPQVLRSGGKLSVDWSAYDAEEGPFLDGTAFGPEHPLPGARATSVDLRTNKALHSAHERTLYWREWERHFKEKGWFDLLYHYVWDEPAPAQFPKVTEIGQLSGRAAPEIPRLVTVPYTRQLAAVVDIWAPLINCFEAKPGFPDFCSQPASRAAYDGELKRGKALWWYQSCASHGCNEVSSEYFRGWPSYAIDAAAISHRIMPWLSWRYKIGGELYFSMNESYSRAADPWTDPYLHGGNGDGSLFYPGTPERIGGARDIPIESIRLKLIRDGLEDYEYLKLLAGNGLTGLADEYAARIASKTYQWERRPEALYEARRSRGEKLHRAIAQ
jgi:hypothetical protein